VPSEWPIRRHGVHDRQLGIMQAAQRKCVIERSPRGLREVDCGENTMKFGHDNYSLLNCGFFFTSTSVNARGSHHGCG
jgi:hypothetical protein